MNTNPAPPSQQANPLAPKNEQRPAWISVVTAGIATGFLTLLLSVTYTALIFTGPLENYLPIGLIVSICGIAIVGLCLNIFSASRHLVAQVDDDTAPVFAILLSLLVASLPAGLSQTSTISHILAAVFITSCITGIVMALFGLFRFGRFIQYLPYSVMGGYFAAVGWLILAGSLHMLVGFEPLSNTATKSLFDTNILPRWLPALIVAIAMHVLAIRFDKRTVLVSSTVLFTAAIFITAAAQNKSTDWLMAKQFLIGPFNSIPSSLFNPATALDWANVDLSNIFTNAGSIVSIVFISLLSIILCINAVSLSTRKDLSIDSELKAAGLANIVAACSGGLLASPSVSVSILSHELSPTESRIKGLVAISVALLVFYFGMELLAYIPKMVLGAILIYIGIGFTIKWLIKGYGKFGPLEYSVIPIILFVAVLIGFLPAMLVGVIAAIVLFTIKYSQVQVVRYETSGAHLQSNLSRNSDQTAALLALGHQVRIFQLQGFLFFGTTRSLYRRVTDAVHDHTEAGLGCVILDFSNVIGVDSSATLNLERLAQRLEEKNNTLVTCGIKPDVLGILQRGALNLNTDDYFNQHVDLDHALEWCEERLLRQKKNQSSEEKGLFEHLPELFPQLGNIDNLNKYLKKIGVVAGQELTTVGELSDEVFFLETCTASAYILDANQNERRVSGAGRGAVYGEIGFFLGVPRTAFVRADTAGELYSLSSADLKLMEQEAPKLAAAITQYLARLVSEKLVNTTGALKTLL